MTQQKNRERMEESIMCTHPANPALVNIGPPQPPAFQLGLLYLTASGEHLLWEEESERGEAMWFT